METRFEQRMTRCRPAHSTARSSTTRAVLSSLLSPTRAARRPSSDKLSVRLVQRALEGRNPRVELFRVGQDQPLALAALEFARRTDGGYAALLAVCRISTRWSQTDSLQRLFRDG